jgi:protein-disulfide isomerase
MNKEAKILIAIAVVVLLGGAALFMFGNPQPKEAGQAVDSQSLVRENSQMTGKRDAKVTIVEFADFQCPGCGALYPTIKRIKDEYKSNDNVNFVYRQFPLVTIHRNAMLAAETSEAAAEQGKFWEMHDKLFENQTVWSESAAASDIFLSYATELGLDSGKVRDALTNHTYREIVNTDIADGEKLGVNSTPTVYVNGIKLDRIPSYEELKQRIEDELKK